MIPLHPDLSTLQRRYPSIYATNCHDQIPDVPLATLAGIRDVRLEQFRLLSAYGKLTKAETRMAAASLELRAFAIRTIKKHLAADTV